MKNEGLMLFYNKAAINSKNYAQLGRVLKCTEASRMNRTQKDNVINSVNMQRRVIRWKKVLFEGDTV